MWGFFGKNFYFGFSEAVCVFGDIFTCKSSKYGPSKYLVGRLSSKKSKRATGDVRVS